MVTLQIIDLAHDSCNIGSIGTESFRQQVWLSYENFFFENYSEKFLKLYQVTDVCYSIEQLLCIVQLEKQSSCNKLMLDTSKIGVEQLSITPQATWLTNFALQLLSNNYDNHFVSSSVDSEVANLLLNFLHDIKCLEYSHTPLVKMQLLTSAFRKCGTILEKLKAGFSELIS